MAITLVGSNSAESNPGGTGYTIPSTLSNAAAIAADDIIILAVSTSEASNALAVAGFTKIGDNFDASAGVFWKKATGAEAAGWAFTCLDAFSTIYTFAVYRGVDPTTPFAPAPPTNTNDLSLSFTSGNPTVPGSTTAVLVLTHSTLTGIRATAPTPSPATTLVLQGVDNTLRLFRHFLFAASVGAGALQYTGTYDQTGNIQSTLFILNPAAGGGGGSSGPLPAVRRATTEHSPWSAVARRLANVAMLVPVSAVSQPPPARQRTAKEFPAEERRIKRPLRLPESVDQPTFLLWASFEERGAEQAPQRRRPLNLGSGAAPVATLPAPRWRAIVEPVWEASLPTRLRRLPESVDMPVLGTWEISPEPMPDELPQRRALKLPDAVVAPVDQPPAQRWRTISDTPPENLRNARARWVLPSGALPAVHQPLARWRTAYESVAEERRIARLRRLPESVDAPPLGRRRAVSDEALRDIAARHLLPLPESVDLPPFPQRVAASPQGSIEEPRNQRPRLLLVPVAENFALPRWCTATEPAPEERLPRRLRRLPESFVAQVDDPPLIRWRNVFDTPLAEGLPRRLWRLPESYVPPPVDDPPQVRWRTISDTPQEDLPIRRYRLLLESGAAPSAFVLAGPGGTVHFRVTKDTVKFRI